MYTDDREPKYSLSTDLVICTFGRYQEDRPGGENVVSGGEIQLSTEEAPDTRLQDQGLEVIVYVEEWLAVADVQWH